MNGPLPVIHVGVNTKTQGVSSHIGFEGFRTHILVGAQSHVKNFEIFHVHTSNQSFWIFVKPGQTVTLFA